MPNIWLKMRKICPLLMVKDSKKPQSCNIFSPSSTCPQDPADSPTQKKSFGHNCCSKTWEWKGDSIPARVSKASPILLLFFKVTGSKMRPRRISDLVALAAQVICSGVQDRRSGLVEGTSITEKWGFGIIGTRSKPEVRSDESWVSKAKDYIDHGKLWRPMFRRVNHLTMTWFQVSE